jgi:hypothetical protein
MPITSTEEKRPELSLEVRQEMERYGIVRVPADNFLYGDFRYTNVQDALAQAKREADRGQRSEPRAASPLLRS